MTLSEGQKVALAVGAAVLAVGGLYVLLSSGAPPKPEKKTKVTEPAAATEAEGVVEELIAPEDADRLKKQGNSKFSEGKFEEAIVFYSKAIDLNPGPSECSKYYANRAACHAKLKNYDAVVIDCTQALQLEPNYIKALHRRAQAYEALGDLESAVKDYARGVQLHTTLTEQQTMSQSAEVLLQKIALKKAKATLEEKKGQFPSSSIIKTYLSTFKKHEVSESEEELSAQAETDATAAYKLGLKLTGAERYHEALAAYTKAVDMDPSLAAAHTERGALQHLSGDIPGSLESFQKAVECDPNSVDAHVKWANALYFAGDTEGANQMLEKAMVLDPNDTVGFFHAAQAMSQQGNPAKAVEYLTKVLELDPSNYEAYNHRGLAYTGTLEKETNPDSARNAVDMAIQDFEKAITLKPNEADAYNSYGLLLRIMGRNEDALAQFDTAIRLAPKSATAYTNKGFHKLHVDGNKSEAKVLFEKALEVDPCFIEALCNLAIVHLESSIDEAVKCYDRAIELSYFEQDLATIYTFREAALLSKDVNPTSA